MSDEIVVSDIVTQTLLASTSALGHHFSRLFASSRDFHDETAVARLLESGEVHDLMDGDSSTGFHHHDISLIFREKLAGCTGRGIDRHIWGADYDRDIRSLFPTGRASNEDRDETIRLETRRTRVSSVVRQALLRSRKVLRADKAATSSADIDLNPPSVFVPSPFYIARQILTDPAMPASDVYASAAIRVELARQIRVSGKPLDFNHARISDALDLIWNRVSTSKPIRAGARLRRGEVLFLCHYLASKGIFSLEVSWRRSSRYARPDKVLNAFSNLFDFQLSRGPQLSPGFFVGFRHHADLAEMPDAGELLNELNGLPLPIEGGGPIFHGGVRFASQGEIVAAISGPSGAGKTSACLTLAAALAPLGCRTLFLSCEEVAQDLQARLAESIPRSVISATPLFRCISIAELNQTSDKLTWFKAVSLRIKSPANGEKTGADVASEIQNLLERLIEHSLIFAPFQEQENPNLPSFARPVIVVDGFHQLFKEAVAGGPEVERSLRQLIDYCRKLRAVFVFTVAAGEMGRLDYLCDIVIELSKIGVDLPEESAGRVFKLLKARRQPAMVGAHPFHLSGPKSFRIKPNMVTFSERAKSLRWFEPDLNARIVLNDKGRPLAVQNRAQILVIGKGSSGKAGLGLYILHRRPVTSEELRPAGKSNESNRRKTSEFYEARTLVISFLYQAQYYKTLAKRLRTSKEEANFYDPNHALVDVISLYPGGLTSEDFLAKVENRLSAAELSGLPYTGVLIDGIHNVFVQYPVLERSTTFWPQLFNLFRRKGVSVVTTHTEFEINSRSLAVDFEQAERRAAPLLSVLISAADYVFELSANERPGRPVEYKMEVRGMLGEDPPPQSFTWDRQGCQLIGRSEQLPLL